LKIREGHCEQNLKAGRIQGELTMHRYLVVIEKADGTFSAYSPDLGRATTGATREEAEERMREAIAFHLEGLREDGLPVPDPQASAAYVAV
jgi:predicted RNase H-like HicB family nuclease